MDEQHLIAAAMEGDREAFASLVRLHQRSLRALAALAMLPPDDVNDVVQEAFIDAYRHLDRFDAQREFGPWLRTICRNRILRFLRDRRTRRRHELAHHRTVSDGYWTEPHASVNRDFTKVAFNTTWGVVTTSDIDTYRIELDADALPGATDGTPPVISAVSANAVISSGATIAWTTDEAADTQVAYGTTSTYGTMTTLATSLVTTHSQALAGLLPATTYHYQVRSRDAAGNLAVSITDRTFTTAAAPDTTSPVISDLVVAHSIRGVVISWNTSEAATTRLIYGATTAYGTTAGAGSSLATTHATTLTGLSAGATYHLRAVSVDAAGNTARSADQVVSIPAAAAAAGDGSPEDGGSDGGCGRGGIATLLAGGLLALQRFLRSGR